MSKKIAVKLSEKDWSELINFVTGDLHNMPSDDPIATHMNEVLDEIRKAIVSQTT